MKVLMNQRRQEGWTIWGLIVVVMLIAFFALLFLKLFPPYMDNYKLQKGLDEVLQEPGIENASRAAILDKLDRILYVDYANHVINLDKTVRVQKTQGMMTISAKYEVVVPLVYNLSALINFDDKAEKKLSGYQ